jgi:hypothetical protein
VELYMCMYMGMYMYLVNRCTIGSLPSDE